MTSNEITIAAAVAAIRPMFDRANQINEMLRGPEMSEDDENRAVIEMTTLRQIINAAANAVLPTLLLAAVDVPVTAEDEHGRRECDAFDAIDFYAKSIDAAVHLLLTCATMTADGCSAAEIRSMIRQTVGANVLKTRLHNVEA